MSKELEALNRICEHLDLDDEYFYLKNGEKTDYKVIEKSLKALEIIKEKGVNVFVLLHIGDLETYNDMIADNRNLTQEEYDILKDVLLCD